MKAHSLIILMLLGSCWEGCTSKFGAYRGLPNATVVTPTLEGEAAARALPFEKVREEWTVRFSIPNPLSEAPGSGFSLSPSGTETGMIRIRAILYDQEVIEAWISQNCRKDSLSDQECKDLRLQYEELHSPQKLFRIELTMESDFAARSLEPDLWAIYLMDDEGIMYEPTEVKAGEIEERQRKVYSEYHGITVTKTQIRRMVELYFPKVTFFGKALLGRGVEFLKLIFSYQKRVVGEGIWAFDFGEETD